MNSPEQRSKWRHAQLKCQTKKLERKLREQGVSDARAVIGTSPSARGQVKTHAGNDCSDIFDPIAHQPSTAIPVSDTRQGRMFCRTCKADVMIEQRDGRWLKIDRTGEEHVCP